jgi:alpha-L-rhamnosidase
MDMLITNRVTQVSIGLDTRSTPRVTSDRTPRLSWKIESSTSNWHQVAYEIKSVDSNGSVSSTGRVESGHSTNTTWPFRAIRSREVLNVQVRVWGKGQPEPTPWSDLVAVEGALYESHDWSAIFVGPEEHPNTERPGPGYLLRRDFDLSATVKIRLARLHITSHGIFQAQVNGTVVGDDVLSPGWTSYSHRLRYRTYVVTAHVQPGANAIGVELADGWFRGPLGFEGGRKDIYGSQIGVLAQLEIEFVDGTTFRVATDGSWRSATGPITRTGLYAGETHDARLEIPGWSSSNFNDSNWGNVQVLGFDLGVLEAPINPPVRRIEMVAPVVTERRSAAVRYDFGQNASGRLRITATGSAGKSFVARHAEVLEGEELGLRPLRRAAATDTFTFGEAQSVTWEPTFTIHGFRFAEITPDEGVEIVRVEMIVLHTDMQRTGTFRCSDPMIDRLHENVVWSMRSNFVDIPMDCPQRDERLGWTGDIQVFAPTATFLYDCEGLLRSWLRDLAAEQAELRTVPFYVPWIELIFPPVPATAWGDAAVLVPDALLQRYGDVAVLREQYNSMCTWVRQVAQLASTNGRWDTGFQFGDWLDPAAPANRPEAGRTDTSIVATAYLFRSATALAGFANLLGKSEDGSEFRALAERSRQAFRHEYVTGGGRLASDAQTAFGLAIMFDLLEENELAPAGKRLADLVTKEGFTIGTGFVGTPLVCDALQRTGSMDFAYQLLNQRQCPSWLYPVTMGATTIWERWDSMLPDGTVNPGEMTSFNHYALGAVADWLHRSVAGLAFADTGGRRLRFAPRPGGGLSFAEATLETVRGRAAIRWERTGDRLVVAVEVPPNSMAEVDLPGALSVVEVGSGSHRFDVSCRPVGDDPVVDPVNPFMVLIEQGRQRLTAEGAVGG